MLDNKTDPREQLAEVNAAISAVLKGGQSYKIGSRALTRADLAELKKLRDDLESQVETGCGPLLERTYVAFFEGR